MTGISLAGIDVKSGEIKKGFLEIAKNPSGNMLNIPFYAISGMKDGPTLLVDGGCHGDEPEGMLAIAKLMHLIDPKKLKGNLIGVPILNVPGFEMRQRGAIYWLPQVDMNRMWPGDPKGSVTAQIAHKYFTEIVPKANYVLSAHGGGRYEWLTWRCIYGDTPEGIELAKAMGGKWNVLQMPRTTGGSRRGTMTGECEVLGIPHVTIECGGGGCSHPDILGMVVDSYIEAYQNVMKHYMMLEGEPTLPKEWYYVKRNDVRASKAGLLMPVKGLKFAIPVEKDTALYEILNPYGKVVELLKAPERGICMGAKTQPCTFSGDTVCWYGDIVKTEKS